MSNDTTEKLSAEEWEEVEKQVTYTLTYNPAWHYSEQGAWMMSRAIRELQAESETRRIEVEQLSGHLALLKAEVAAYKDALETAKKVTDRMGVVITVKDRRITELQAENAVIDARIADVEEQDTIHWKTRQILVADNRQLQRDCEQWAIECKRYRQDAERSNV